MSTNEFLSAVLPTTGKYCAFTMAGAIKKNVFVDTTDNLIQTVEKFNKVGAEVWFALAAFDSEGYRKAENAQAIRSIFMDLDCGVDIKTGKPKAFASKRAAVEQLGAFLKTTGLNALGEPWLVDSGGGVHVYWPLDEDEEVAAWKPVVESLKRVAAEHKFPLDATVTSDAARVLRMPGTHNHKYNPPRPVILRQLGNTFHLADIAARLPRTSLTPKRVTQELALLGPRPTALKPLGTVAAAMAGNSVTYFKNIMIRTAKGNGCSQLAHYVDRASDDGMEPLWRGLLSLTTVCADGVKAAAKLSSLHPYDFDRMRQKLGEVKGPYTCAALDSANPGVCKDCPNFRKITTPLMLGREVIVDVAEKEIDVGTAQAAQTVHRPVPPKGYYYGKMGGLYFTVKATKETEENQEIMLTNYDFFMTRMFREDDTYMAEFVCIKGGVHYTFGIPSTVTSSVPDTIKVLAGFNVIAVQGRGADLFLANYVRACITEASAEGKEVPVPARLGWQQDNSFAVGDTIYSSKGRAYDYTYKSAKIHNVIEATRTDGTLEGWRNVMHMLRDKAVGTPRIWGHISVGLAGFASALMKFGPARARASTIHVAGTGSGAGKTLAVSLAVSVWGDGDKYLVNPRTAERTMMQRAGLLGSLPLVIDEVTSKTRSTSNEWLYDYMYDYAAGTHKIKGSANGNTEVFHECMWEALSVVSSNVPVLEHMLGARDTTSAGEVKRFLEWKLPRDWAIEWEPHEREALRLLERNHGIAGREWIKWLVANHDTAHMVWNQIEARWRAIAAPDDTERFWTTTVVSIMAMTILLGPAHANILEIPLSPIEAFCLGLVNNMRKTIDTNKRNAMDILHAYTREFAGNMVQVQKDILLSHLGLSPSSSVKGAVRGRVERDVTPGMIDYYLEVKMIKVHCAKLNSSYSEWLKEMESIAVVKEGRKDLLAGTPGPSMRVNCLRISCPIELIAEAGID